MWDCEIPNLEKKYLQFFRPLRLSHRKIISIKTCVGFPGPLKVKISFQCSALKCSLILMEKLFLRKSIRSRRSRLEEIMVTSSRLSFGDLCKRDGGAFINIYLSLLGYRFPAKAENIMERDTNPPPTFNRHLP